MNQTIKEWKVLESEYLVRRPWLTARRDRLELPDGRIIPEYYVLEYPDWVNVIAITKDGQFVMERQYRHAARKISLELPCGVMEEGETPLEARLSQEKINSWFSNEITTFVLTKCQNSPSNKEGVSPAVCRSSKSGFPYRSISSFRERLSIVETLKTRRSS